MDRAKDLIKKIPGAIRVARYMRDPAKARKHAQDVKLYASEVERISAMVDRSQAPDAWGRVLVVSIYTPKAGAKIEGLLAHVLDLHGANCTVLTNRHGYDKDYFQAWKSLDLIFIEDLVTGIDDAEVQAELEEAVASIRNMSELMNYRYRGIGIGKYIASTVLRKTIQGNIDFSDPQIGELIRERLAIDLQTALAAEKLFDVLKPRSCLFLERGYNPYGVFFDLCLQRDIPAVQWCGSHRDDALMLKRYSQRNQSEHPASLSTKTWERLRTMPWTQAMQREVEDELVSCYRDQTWFSEVGTQFNTQLMEQQRVRDLLQLDPQRKTAVIFSHLFWDATFFWGEDLFADYKEWFVETIKVACRNTALNWIIKVHPANLVKLARDGYTGELAEVAAIREEIGDLPAHIRIMPPDTPVSTLSLLQTIDYCLTVRGTIGIESAFFGVRTLTAGTGRYDGHGFTDDSASTDEYLDKVGKLQDSPPMSEEEKELAARFAYGTFIQRRFNLQSFRFTYQKEGTADRDIGIALPEVELLHEQSDMQAFSQWLLHSDDEDFVN